MKQIKLTQDAYLNGGSVRDGLNELTAWYEATGEDANSNTYRVIWSISNPDTEDECDTCNWSTPWAILDEHYNNVINDINIVDNFTAQKSYKDYARKYIGNSDIAALTVRMPEDGELNSKYSVFNLAFGKDGSYDAYIVDCNAEIGSHYTEVMRGNNWIKIYDDEGLTFKATAESIIIYRAGEQGCIIQLID